MNVVDKHKREAETDDAASRLACWEIRFSWQPLHRYFGGGSRADFAAFTP
jgi:hypothetical protein